MKDSQYYLHCVLRVSCGMCFVGHGAFGIITKQVWCNYFAVFGITESIAYQLMPVVGTVDILLGIVFLFFPIKAIALWMTAWAFFTALLRPLSGEPIAEFFERAGNFGAPLILLLSVGSSRGNLLRPITPDSNIERPKTLIALVLRITAFILLVAHGWLNVTEKNALLSQYNSVGISNPQSIAHIIGMLEIFGGVMILLKPYRELVLIFLCWKIISEMFYPSYGLFEWIERGGSYGIMFGVWLTTNYVLQLRRTRLLET
jgi:uncharacterized membrane protein YphA (DoxX/SURF4 family)